MAVSDRGAVFALFFLFILKVTAQGNEVREELGLATEAFDDQYVGCRQAMERKLDSQQVLKAEIEKNPYFRRAWKEAEIRWHSKTKECVKAMLPEGFHDSHGVALVAYSGFIREFFIEALKTAGKSYQTYMDNFHYKALHYYLTVALQLLAGGCRDNSDPLYRGFENVFYSVPNKTVVIKFGYFLQTSPDQLEQLNGGNATFLTLYSCSAVPIDKFSEFPHEKEVVVSGSEVFAIEEEQTAGNEYFLTSTGKQCSNFNCAFIKGQSSKQSVEGCISSAPPGTALCSVAAALVAGLTAAAMARW